MKTAFRISKILFVFVCLILMDLDVPRRGLTVCVCGGGVVLTEENLTGRGGTTPQCLCTASCFKHDVLNKVSFLFQVRRSLTMCCTPERRRTRENNHCRRSTTTTNMGVSPWSPYWHPRATQPQLNTKVHNTTTMLKYQVSSSSFFPSFIPFILSCLVLLFLCMFPISFLYIRWTTHPFFGRARRSQDGVMCVSLSLSLSRRTPPPGPDPLPGPNPPRGWTPQAGTPTLVWPDIT